MQRNGLLNVGTANPYPLYTGTLALNDPLSDNSNGYFWVESNDSGGGCGFSGSAYHIYVSQLTSNHYCPAGVTNFSNFTYQVQMTVVRGDAGGIVFRIDDANQSDYYFRIGIDGSYALDIYKDNSFVSNLTSGSNTVINTGLNQSNLLAVVANGSNIILYVNNQQLASVSDSTYSQGEIGMVASSFSNPAEAVFTNAKVWTF
ncbi:MAG TPA: hypothetical protein VNW73_11665 [Ktedonobacteraceae bacterium]|nr:hypothetical protein [Ktedonobacteraceae bacterium]